MIEHNSQGNNFIVLLYKLQQNRGFHLIHHILPVVPHHLQITEFSALVIKTVAEVYGIQNEGARRVGDKQGEIYGIR